MFGAAGEILFSVPKIGFWQAQKKHRKKTHKRNPMIIIIIFGWPKSSEIDKPMVYIWTGAQIQLSFVAVYVADCFADFVDEFVADFVAEVVADVVGDVVADFVADFVADVGAAGEIF